ncbi:MAG: arginine--tRNA ligase [Arcobacter sp.]|nr:MAG: arginine--tRNA ligase [Arcobacter sp.]
MKQRVLALLSSSISQNIVLEKPKDKSFGHFATPIAFAMAKELRKSPMIIATELVDMFKDESMFANVEAVKGYLNFKLSENFLDEYATWALDNQEDFGKGQGKEKILLEFVSANPTGPLHIGHARGAVYGDTLLRLGRHVGHTITAEYYVNDAGNQIALLGTSLILEGKANILKEKVEYPETYYRGEYLTQLAQIAADTYGNDVFNDEEKIKEVALWAKDEVMKMILSDLNAINVHFDTFVSESGLYADWDRVMDKLEAAGGTELIDGKTWLKSSERGDEKDRVIVREDGRPTYLAGDIIYHNQKFERDYDECINIWGADHHGYMARVRASLSFLGHDESKLDIQLAQMVSLLKDGKPFKMSKRAGTVVGLNDVVEEIGADALRFMFASKKSDTPLEFDLVDLQKTDSSNPIFYINYAHARIQTLLKKSEKTREEIMSVSLKGMGDDADNLLFEAMLLNEVVEDAFKSRQVQKLPDYLKALASSYHKFYYDHKVIGVDNEAKLLKLFLVVALSIKTGLSLLGITAKDRM